MSDWTVDTLHEHWTKLREADQAALHLLAEKDALAVQLARSGQDYKDEKANELRSQIESERGSYATKTMVIGLYGFVVVALAAAVTLIVALK